MVISINVGFYPINNQFNSKLISNNTASAYTYVNGDGNVVSHNINVNVANNNQLATGYNWDPNGDAYYNNYSPDYNYPAGIVGNFEKTSTENSDTSGIILIAPSQTAIEENFPDSNTTINITFEEEIEIDVVNNSLTTWTITKNGKTLNININSVNEYPTFLPYVMFTIPPNISGTIHIPSNPTLFMQLLSYSNNPTPPPPIIWTADLLYFQNSYQIDITNFNSSSGGYLTTNSNSNASRDSGSTQTSTGFTSLPETSMINSIIFAYTNAQCINLYFSSPSPQGNDSVILSFHVGLQIGSDAASITPLEQEEDNYQDPGFLPSPVTYEDVYSADNYVINSFPLPELISQSGWTFTRINYLNGILNAYSISSESPSLFPILTLTMTLQNFAAILSTETEETEETEETDPSVAIQGFQYNDSTAIPNCLSGDSTVWRVYNFQEECVSISSLKSGDYIKVMSKDGNIFNARISVFRQINKNLHPCYEFENDVIASINHIIFYPENEELEVSDQNDEMCQPLEIKGYKPVLSSQSKIKQVARDRLYHIILDELDNWVHAIIVGRDKRLLSELYRSPELKLRLDGFVKIY